MTGSIGLSDSSSAISNTGWGCSWDYDRYGNRWHQNAYNGSCPTPTFSFTQQNNRIDGYSYDAAGNLLSGGTHTYVYDAENRIVSGDNGSFTYVYDAQGRRVKRTGTENVEYLYDLGGSAVTTLSASDGSWIRGEIYAGGHHIGTYADSTTYFTHADWLGTERAHTQMDGGLHQWCTNLPFGDAQNCTGSDPSPRHFTGKERDSESGLDYFGARYYGSTMGRWLSADWSSTPLPVPYADLTNPQTLNLYGYVANNPIGHADIDGHDGDDKNGGAVPSEMTCGSGGPSSGCVGQPQPQSQEWSLEWQVKASSRFLGQEVKGAWEATGGAMLDLGKSLLNGEAEKNIVTTATWLATSPGRIGEALKEGGHEIAQTAQAAKSGDPHAIGEVVGIVAALAYTAGNVRIRAPYPNSGGGGLNVLNTPTRGSHMQFDIAPIQKGGPYRPHVDITIKKPGVPSGPGSNLIRPIRHWPWQ